MVIDHANKVAHLFEVKWSDLNEDDVRRIGRELLAKARYVPLKNYEYRLHVIARGLQRFRVAGHRGCDPRRNALHN